MNIINYFSKLYRIALLIYRYNEKNIFFPKSILTISYSFIQNILYENIFEIYFENIFSSQWRVIWIRNYKYAQHVLDDIWFIPTIDRYTRPGNYVASFYCQLSLYEHSNGTDRDLNRRNSLLRDMEDSVPWNKRDFLPLIYFKILWKIEHL